MLGTPLFMDFAKLEELADGDSEFKDQILSLVIDQSEETQNEIEDFFSHQSLERLKEAAHKYKSSVHILGNQELVSLFQRLEELCRMQGKKQEILEVAIHAKKICQALIDQLKGELK